MIPGPHYFLAAESYSTYWYAAQFAGLAFPSSSDLLGSAFEAIYQPTMSASKKLLTKDLLQLTADDVRAMGCYIGVKDPENLTAEHYQKFRDMSAEMGRSKVLQTDELDEKLQ